MHDYVKGFVNVLFFHGMRRIRISGSLIPQGTTGGGRQPARMLDSLFELLQGREASGGCSSPMRCTASTCASALVEPSRQCLHFRFRAQPL